MRRRTMVASVALAGVLAYSGIAAAATSQFRGTFEGQPSSSIGFSVTFKDGKPKRALISWNGAQATCTTGQTALNGVFQRVPIKKQGGRYVFEADWIDGGDDAHIEGAFKPNLRKITGDLDHSRLITAGFTCSFENAPFTAKKA